MTAAELAEINKRKILSTIREISDSNMSGVSQSEIEQALLDVERYLDMAAGTSTPQPSSNSRPRPGT